MITFLVGIAIGLVAAWCSPQPEFAADLRRFTVEVTDKVKARIKSFR
jgi:hypothetical protein